MMEWNDVSEVGVVYFGVSVDFNVVLYVLLIYKLISINTIGWVLVPFMFIEKRLVI